mgnify:CR=1 FL=1
MTQVQRTRRPRPPQATHDVAALLADLNPEQRAVAEHRDGALLVPAVAGAGKTRALVHRIAVLVASGVVGARICAMTFSKAAAREMNERLFALGITEARVGTAHSVALGILRDERPDVANGWRVDDSDAYRGIVKMVVGFRGMDWKAADLTECTGFITRCKAALALPGSDDAAEMARENFERRKIASRQPQRLLECYERAEAERESRQLLTFDDMLVMTWAMFRDVPEVLARWQNRYDYVLQDEAQDENKAQGELARMLAREHGNYMVVGDPAQSIYGFRGAHPEVLLSFDSQWKNAKTILMHRNYRCGRAIAAAANGVLGAMDPATKLDMTITAEREIDGDVSLEVHEDMDDEARSVAARMLARHAEGVAWRDMATLYRTNAQSRSIEESLLAERIPHVVVGGTSFYNRKEVKDLLAYLRVAEGRARGEDVRRCLNAPFRYLGSAFVERVEAAEHERGDRSWPDVVRDVAQASVYAKHRTGVEQWARIVAWMAREVAAQSDVALDEARDDDLVGDGETRGMPAGILERLLTETKYLEWLARDEGTESTENSRSSNVREMVRVARRFRTASEFLDFVDETQDAQERAAQDRTADRVTLTTLHRSKGLEWRDVYLVSVNDRILPHARAEDPGEERRLFYVGVTRARDALRVSYVRTAALAAGSAFLAPSRFLEEAGLALGKSTLRVLPDADPPSGENLIPFPTDADFGAS